MRDLTKEERARLARSTRERTIGDLLRYPTVRKLAAIWLPYVAIVGGIGLAQTNSLFEFVAAVASGVIGYSLIEYLSHRFVYHRPTGNRLVRLLTGDAARNHLRHHHDPRNFGGAINATQVPVLGIAIVLALSPFVTGVPWGFALVAFAVGALGYVSQELIHFGTHHMPMRHPLLQHLRRHHMLHHYRDGGANFGLSWTIWDRVFGTAYTHDARHKRKSA